MLWIFFAVCWACAWCFDHNRPELGIFIGCVFGVFFLINRWIGLNSVRVDDDDEDYL